MGSGFRLISCQLVAVDHVKLRSLLFKLRFVQPPNFLCRPLLMHDLNTTGSNPSRLVILLNNVSMESSESAFIPLRYALTAAAMDVAVEMHAVSQSVALFRRGADLPAFLAQVRQAVELGVEIFVCPVAMAEQGLSTKDLIEEVAGVRGAASLVAAGLGSRARFLVF